MAGLLFYWPCKPQFLKVKTAVKEPELCYSEAPYQALPWLLIAPGLNKGYG